MDQIETGVDVPEHLPFEIVDNHPAGRGRLHIPGADWGGGIDDDDGKPEASDPLCLSLGQELGTLVRADHFLQRDRCLLRSREPVLGDPQRANRACIDCPLYSDLEGGLQNVSGPLYIGPVHLGLVS